MSVSRHRLLLLVTWVAGACMLYLVHLTLQDMTLKQIAQPSQTPLTAQLQNTSVTTSPNYTCNVQTHKVSDITIAAISIQPCTWDIFKAYYSSNGYTQAGSYWEMNSSDIEQSRFVPNLPCQFRHNETEIVTLFRECLERQGWTKIVTIGDSNGKRYHEGLAYWLRRSLSGCKVTKQEHGGLPNIKYYTQDPDSQRLFKVEARFCSTCTSKQQMCNLPGSQTINLTLEHLAATEVIDRTLRTLKSPPNSILPIPETSSAVEYYLRSYLTKELPNILIIAPPFVHDRAYPLSEGNNRIHQLCDLVHKHVPSKVKVIWLPQITTWKFPRPVFQKLTADFKSFKLNQELVRVIQTSSWKNWYLFYNLQSVNCNLKSFTEGNKVHMTQWFYNEMMSHLLQLLCIA